MDTQAQTGNAPLHPNEEGMSGDQAMREFLAFKLGKEEYGIDILKVQEIRGYETVTRIANAPDFLKGVVNLRGIIVPIVDMRIRFNLGEPTYDQFTVVIILNIAGRVVGMVVDSVSDVTTLAPSQIYAWVGVVFATVMMGRLASAWGPLLAGLFIGLSESFTMALTAPTWAPLVSFTLLILILLTRRGHD